MIFNAGLDLASFNTRVAQKGWDITKQYGLIPTTALAATIGTNWDTVAAGLTTDQFESIAQFYPDKSGVLGVSSDELQELVTMGVEFKEMAPFITRRTLANEFQSIDPTTLERLGVMKPWWMSYYGQTTKIAPDTKQTFTDLSNLYFGIQLKSANQLPCDATMESMKEKSDWLWRQDEGKKAMNVMRELIFDTMSGGRPAPLKGWSDYLKDSATAMKYSKAYAATITSSGMVQILNEADPAVARQVIQMSSQVLYTLNSQFLPTQTPDTDKDVSHLTDAEMLAKVQQGLPTANGVTLAVMREMQRKVAAYVAVNIQLKGDPENRNYDALAQYIVNITSNTSSGSAGTSEQEDDEKDDDEHEDEMHELYEKLLLEYNPVQLATKLSDAAKECFKVGCSPSEWAKQNPITEEKWDSNTRLTSWNRIGQWLAVGSFFMDMAPIFEGKTLPWQEQLSIAAESIEAIAKSSNLIEDTAAKFLRPVMNSLEEKLVSEFTGYYQSVADRTLSSLDGKLTRSLSTVLGNAETVANVLGVVASGVMAVTDILSAIKDFQTGAIVAGASAVVEATSASIALVAGGLSLLLEAGVITVAVPFLAPLSIGVAIVGLLIGLFEPPPPPPPSGPQLVCKALITMKVSTKVTKPSPSPPQTSRDAWSVFEPGTTFCSEIKAIAATSPGNFAKGFVEAGPCAQYGYTQLATNCLFQIKDDPNAPVESTLPGPALKGQKRRIWIKPFSQPAPGTWHVSGRRLLGQSEDELLATALARGLLNGQASQEEVATRVSRVLLSSDSRRRRRRAPPTPSPAAAAGLVTGETMMYLFNQDSPTICAQFTVPFPSSTASSNFALSGEFNLGQCQDHGFYSLVTKDGKAVLKSFTSGPANGVEQYNTWTKPGICGNLPDFTPNRNRL